MAFKLAEAYVEFSQKGVSQVNAGVKSVKGSLTGATAAAKAMVASIAAIGAASVLRSMWGFVEAAAEAEKQTAKLEAVLASTAGVSGQTVESLEAHASALQKVTAFEDDTIKGAQAVLLTFKKIGGETFPQATEAALDLATVFEGDLRGAAMMVGKAMEDPVRGITALRRAGVSFTKDQQEVIKSLVETGKVAEAQAQILREIHGQVGGSARKVGDTTFGQIEQLKNAMGDLAEEIGAVLTPAVKVAASALRSLTAGKVPVSPVVRLANRESATKELEGLTRNLQGAQSQSEARSAMAAINSFMVGVALKGVDPAQFEGIRDKAFTLAKGRMGSLPAFSEAQLAQQKDATSKSLNDRYREGERRQVTNLRGKDMERTFAAWESLQNVDFSAMKKIADLEASSLRAQQMQELHLREIKEELVRQRYQDLEKAWDGGDDTARYN